MTRVSSQSVPGGPRTDTFAHRSCGQYLRPLILLLILFQILPLVARGMQTAPSNPAVEKAKQELSKIPLDGKLTVTKTDGTEYHGRLESIDSETFVMREVDLKQTLTISYAEVNRIRKNYGGKGFGGHRVNPRTNLIAGIVTGAVLLALVIALVASDKS